jgi:threonine/homoserine/homoserine lactone efflux protein
MSTIEFTAEVVLLSASGVLSPGPLFLANLIYGSKGGLHSGIEIAIGHTTVELPLIILLALGIFQYSSFTLTDESLRIIGLIGGIAIIMFSMAQLSNMIKKREDIVDIHDKRSRNKDKATSLLNRIATRIEGRPIIIVGILFTAMNPFFIIWWLTVGLKLISDSIYLFGIIEGIIILFSSHSWMDYAWLAITAYLISKGRTIIRERLYHFFLLSISFLLAFYGISLVVGNIL